MRSALLAAALVALAGSTAASTFLDILPPGQDGLVPETGTPGPHAGDQVAIYADLILAAPGLKQNELLRLYKDAGIDAPATPEPVEHRRDEHLHRRGALRPDEDAARVRGLPPDARGLAGA